MQALTDDFAGHNVDASAALVEGAGFFLARLPATRARMFKALEASLRPTLHNEHYNSVSGDSALHHIGPASSLWT